LTGPSTGSTSTPFTVSRTYTVSGVAIPGNFTIGYYASTDNVFGNADDVLLGTETISNAADKSVGSHAGTSPALSFSSGGTYYLFAKVDNGNTASETDESNNVAQAPAQVVGSGPVIVDNGAPGYAETGSGWLGWPTGYNGSVRYHNAGSGADTASWQLGGLAAGDYTVQSTWNGSSNHASNATYQIYDGSTLVQTVVVNQRTGPTGALVGGGPSPTRSPVAST